MLHPELAHRFYNTPGLLGGVCLREHAAVCRAAELGRRIRSRGTEDLEVEELEFIQCSSLFEAEAVLAFEEGPFFGGGVAGGVEEDLDFVAAVVEDGEFGGGRWGAAFHVGQADAVFADVFDEDVGDVRGDVAV